MFVCFDDCGVQFTFFFFFFNDTATTEIYTLSLHDALPIYRHERRQARHADREEARDRRQRRAEARRRLHHEGDGRPSERSEEHTSGLQSPCNLVCRLLLGKKKKNRTVRASLILQKVKCASC